MSEAGNTEEAGAAQAPLDPGHPPASGERRAGLRKAHTGSLSQRMMMIAAVWIIVLLLAGGLALDRAMTNLV
ncbi:MAG TPA: histidine kinase, partial [Novosphingobium sp.]|nr:histidine kinase [Novosphingobium sp.]